MKKDSSVEMKMLTSAAAQSNAQLRKIKKPLIERRRRERINDCLCQLKSLVLEAMNRDESCYSKMEKADILEMTVAHLRSTQRHPMSFPMSSTAPVMSIREDAMKKYLLGFNECAKEVGKYLSGIEELADNVGVALMRHLVMRLSSFQPDTGILSKEILSSGVDDNFSPLVPPGNSVVQDLSDSRAVAAVSLNPDLFREVVPLNGSSIPFVSVSSDITSSCRVSCIAENNSRFISSSAGNSEDERDAIRLRSSSASSNESGASTFLSSSSDTLYESQLWQRRSVASQEQQSQSFVLLTQKSHPMISSYFSSALLTSAPAVIPDIPTDIERTIKSEVLLSGSIWRPW